MEIFSLLPPGLVQLLTWLVYFLAGSALILIICIGMGRLLSEFVDSLLGWIR
jgi:hypothetical protein